MKAICDNATNELLSRQQRSHRFKKIVVEEKEEERGESLQMNQGCCGTS